MSIDIDLSVSPATGASVNAAGRRSLRVVTVIGSPNEKSKTAGLADVILATLERALDPHGIRIEQTRVAVYDLGRDFTEAREREGLADDIEAVVRQVEQTDLLIAATPVFRGSYTGLFKHLFDLVDQYALANTPVLLAATGGGERHALVLEHQLRPLFGFFQAMTLPVAVFASSGDFDGTTLLTPRVYGRIEVAIADVVEIVAARAVDRA